jgi:GNAT superfamily N-acetyltransferase
MRVRSAEPDDMAAVAQMARALAAHVRDPDPGEGTDALTQNCFGPDRWCECLVVEAADTLLGFALACRRFEAGTGHRSLWISDLYVSPEARRIGAGRALLRALAERAREQGCIRLGWDVWRENDVARAFYARVGAHIDDEIVVMVAPLDGLMAAKKG